jgi:hypothetical protein
MASRAKPTDPPPREDLDLRRGLYRKVYSDWPVDPRINSLSMLAENTYLRLHFLADDYGKCNADPRLIVCLAFPLRRNVTEERIEAAFAELVEAGLVSTYRADGQTYAHIIGFEDAQPAGKNGRKVRRFPAPVGIHGNPEKSEIPQTHHDHDQNQDESQAQKPKPGRSPKSSSPPKDDDVSAPPLVSPDDDSEFACDLDKRGTPAYTLVHKWKVPKDIARGLYEAGIAEGAVAHCRANEKDNLNGFLNSAAENPENYRESFKAALNGHRPRRKFEGADDEDAESKVREFYEHEFGAKLRKR